MSAITVTFDQAVELLEITHIEDLTLEKLEVRVKAIKKRWHPDRVAHLKDQTTIDRFTHNFQLIEPSVRLIEAYLRGEYRVGDQFNTTERASTTEPHEVIRANADNMISVLKEVLPLVKEKKYQHKVEEVVLSDGFLLKDFLREEFKEGLAKSALISFWMYNSTIGILTLIALVFFPTIGKIGLAFWIAHFLSCLLAFLPLSRLWLPDRVQLVVFWFVGIGLKIHNIIGAIFSFSFIVQISLWFTRMLANLVQYLFLFPLYEIARALVKDKVVGTVKQKFVLYADISEDHIDELLLKSPDRMNEDELYTLSHLYTNLIDVKAEYA